MIADVVTSTGILIYIISKYGIKFKSKLLVEKKNLGLWEPRLYWRTNPKLGCEFSFIKNISKSGDEVNLLFPDMKISFEVVDSIERPDGTILTGSQLVAELLTYLLDILKKSHHMKLLERDFNSDKVTFKQNSSYVQTISLRNSNFKAVSNEESLLELCQYLKCKEGYMIVEKAVRDFRIYQKSAAFKKWVQRTKLLTDRKMEVDRHRWRLHATANQEIDLQAWYHALFFKEVYRLRGYFWYKDAVLPSYRQSYDLVDNALTPLEEAALAHVLCSPDTSYGDVAGQMFVVQALTPPVQFALFQQLAAQGAQVVKYPRQGRPAKKAFRFSFVEGNIYLTWKGKLGNQGVGMGEVTSVVPGIGTEVLKWSAQSTKADQYLSLVCADRSVDLFFETVEERNSWKDLLIALHSKEQGNLIGVEPMGVSIDENEEFEHLVLYSSIGKPSF